MSPRDRLLGFRPLGFKRQIIEEGRWKCLCGRSHTRMIDACPYWSVEKQGEWPQGYVNPEPYLTDTATPLDVPPTTSTSPPVSSSGG